MLFTSYSFVLFVAAVLLLYYIVPRKFQWPLLLVASYYFYYCADTKGRYLLFITVTSVVTWICGIVMDKIGTEGDAYVKAHKADLSKEERKAYKAQVKHKKNMVLLLSLLITIGILAVTKYTNFVITNINSFLKPGNAIRAMDIIVPLGISFYTFQAASYLIDVSRGTIKSEKNFFKMALFVSYFPQLVQGPISRFGDLSQTLYEPHKFELNGFGRGLIRILWGYFKKLVIADRIMIAIKPMITITDKYFGTYVFIAMLFYAFELYCDFTGGIDITIGISECMGIKLKENFILPYFSKNVKEYWNRWHITMGTWFTDYIFYPLSVSPRMLKLSKWSRSHLGDKLGKRVTVYLSCFLVWLATGVWHGAAWNFIVWGLANYVIIMVSQELEPLYAKFHGKFHLKDKPGYAMFEICRTIFIMSCIRLFDCYRNVPLTFKMIGSMFTKANLKVYVDGSLMELGLTAADYTVLVIGFIIVLGVGVYKAQTKKDVRTELSKNIPLFCLVCVLLVISVAVLGAYGNGYDSTQFIYNQF